MCVEEMRTFTIAIKNIRVMYKSLTYLRMVYMYYAATEKNIMKIKNKLKTLPMTQNKMYYK